MEPIIKTDPYADTANPAVAAAGLKSSSDTPKTNDSQKNTPANPDTDRYTPDEKHPSIGLYSVDTDENGKREIFFDAPEQADDRAAASQDAPPNPLEESPKSDESKKNWPRLNGNLARKTTILTGGSICSVQKLAPAELPSLIFMCGNLLEKSRPQSQGQAAQYKTVLQIQE